MRSYNKYCTYCGVENKKNSKRCIACNKELNAKDQLLKEYLIENINEKKTKLKMSDSYLKVIFSFLKNHFYGVFTLTTIFVCLIICIVNLCGIETSKKNEVKTIKDIKNVRSCVINEAAPVTYTCDEEHELEYKKCIKYNTVDASQVKTCNQDSFMVDGICYSKDNVDFIDGRACPDYVSGENTYYKYDSKANKCIQYKCNSINFSNNSITCNSSEEATGLEIDTIYKKVCPEGYYDLKSSCKKIIEPEIKYTCLQGELIENKCKIKEFVDSSIKCEEGYKLEPKCNLCVKE